MFSRINIHLKKSEGFGRQALILSLLAPQSFFLSPRESPLKKQKPPPRLNSVSPIPVRRRKARHYTYSAPGGITIKYFIIKSSDGVIRAAFDACDVCWPSGKGYQQEGGLPGLPELRKKIYLQIDR